MGGKNGLGDVFSIKTNGSGFKDLLDFNDTNGRNPFLNSLLLSGKTLYGMTEQGGVPYKFGNIFSIDTNGSGYKNLYTFIGSNGKDPSGSLIISGNTLFGMTPGGGVNNYGLIFSIHTDGSGYKDLFDFNNTNGNGGLGSLLLSGHKIYGMTNQRRNQ